MWGAGQGLISQGGASPGCGGRDKGLVGRAPPPRLTGVPTPSPARWKVHSTCACSERGSHSRKALPPSTPNTFRSSSAGWDESGGKKNVRFRPGKAGWGVFKG